jgi:very-short-patch-repair endonuclease
MNSITRARALRQTMPETQRRMWRLLRDRRFAGYKMRREHPVGPYVLDFYCAEAKLSLELDGSQHGKPGHKQHDEAKERYLLSRGIVTKRFWNSEVRSQPEVVKQNLWCLLQDRMPHPENVPVGPTARSRTWPGSSQRKSVPLLPNRLPRKTRRRSAGVDAHSHSHPSPRPSPR